MKSEREIVRAIIKKFIKELPAFRFYYDDPSIIENPRPADDHPFVKIINKKPTGGI